MGNHLVRRGAIEVGGRAKVPFRAANSQDDQAGAPRPGSGQDGIRGASKFHREIGRLQERLVARQHFVQSMERFGDRSLALAPVAVACFTPLGKRV